MPIHFGMLPIVKEFEFGWTHLPDLSCVHKVECLKSSACWHILCYGTELYFPWAFPRHGYPADPTGTNCSSALGQVGWLRGYVAKSCSSDTEKHKSQVPGSMHRTRAAASRNYQTENPQQPSTKHMDVKNPIVFKVRAWEEKINILLAATRNVFFWRPVKSSIQLLNYYSAYQQDSMCCYGVGQPRPFVSVESSQGIVLWYACKNRWQLSKRT